MTDAAVAALTTAAGEGGLAVPKDLGGTLGGGTVLLSGAFPFGVHVLPFGFPLPFPLSLPLPLPLPLLFPVSVCLGRRDVGRRMLIALPAAVASACIRCISWNN